jgi:hypothetical protein
VRLNAGVSGVIAKNILGFAPAGTVGSIVMVDDLATGTVESNNSTDSPSGGQMKIGPGFTNGMGTFSAATDFTVLGASYSVSGGATVPVFQDFFGAARPVGSWDIGAAEQ